jgi:hypothetical protein
MLKSGLHSQRVWEPLLCVKCFSHQFYKSPQFYLYFKLSLIEQNQKLFVFYDVHKNQPLCHIMSQFNPACTLTSLFLKCPLEYYLSTYAWVSQVALGTSGMEGLEPKYSRVSFCNYSFYDNSLLRLSSSWTEHSRLVVHHCRNSSVLSLLSALLAFF